MAPDVIVAGHDISINMREMIQKSIRGAPITEDWLRVKAMVSKKKLPDDVRSVPCPSSESSSSC